MTCSAKTCAMRSLTFLDGLGSWAGLLGLRLLLAYEFWQSGVEKFRGDNWFGEIQSQFPFPFSVVPVDISWFLSTWVELIGPVMLLLGLGTRFWALSLLILDIVAWQAVHAGNGYNVCDNGFKLPLMYLLMLIPLVLSGPGKLSLDHGIRQRYLR
ncbi:MAG: DoxX family protein [Thiobacillus sp.]|nr:DoxX family protein [Thiobacillus sp.]